MDLHLVTLKCTLFLLCLVYEGVNGDDCGVVNYGARCDGRVDDTSSIQKAINACAYKGRVVFPENKVCLSFPLDLPSGTTLYLPYGATLKAGSIAHWPNNTRFNFFDIRHRQDIIVSGKGTIDGSGAQWWSLEGNKPRMFHMQYVDNVSFRDVHLINAGAMTLVMLTPCTKAHISGISIKVPAVGETDGIDMGCDGAIITDVYVSNGDDSICMKSGAKNVLVQNSITEAGIPWPAARTRGRADGFVLGTSGDNDMHNITFRNCTAKGTLRGITMKFRPTQTGTIKNIVFEDMHIFNPTAYAIGINIGSPHMDHSLTMPGTQNISNIHTVHLSDILFKDITAVADVPGHFSCESGDYKCSGIRMEHVHFENTKEPCKFKNVYGTATDVEPASCIPPKGI